MKTIENCNVKIFTDNIEASAIEQTPEPTDKAAKEQL